MKAVVLAAGRGSRLKPLTDSAPKCMTEVYGVSILQNGLDALSGQGVGETKIAVGYLGQAIRDFAGTGWNGMRVGYVENPVYDQTSTSYSLWLALKDETYREGLIILEGDVFFEDGLVRRLLSRNGENLTVVEKYNPNLDGSFVDIRGGSIVDWIHTSRRESDFEKEKMYKTVNIHLFNPDFVEGVLKPELRQSVEEKDGSEPIEYVMQRIVRSPSGRILPFSTDMLKWVEIDDENDLRLAEEMFGRPGR